MQFERGRLLKCFGKAKDFHYHVDDKYHTARISHVQKGCSLRLWLLQNKIACRQWNMMEKPQAVLVCSVNIGKFIIPGSVIKTSKCRLKSHLFILRKNCFTLLPGALGDVIAAICAAATSLTSHTGSDNLGTIGICRSRSRR